MSWNCLCSSKKSKKSKYNENIKNHKVPENVGPENRKPKFYNSLGLDQCDRNPKTNNSSSLDSQFDQKSINELNEHLYDSYDTFPNLQSSRDANKKSFQNSRPARYEDDNVSRPKHLILCLSNENLPFIDSDSPSCSYHDRIIQMMPKNLIVSKSAERRNITASEWERLHNMQKALNISKHKYIEIDVMDTQICQKCHKHLSFKKTFKCLECEYTCHQACADKSGGFENGQQLERTELHNRSKRQPSPPKSQPAVKINYVTERIIAAVLPAKENLSKIDDLFVNDGNRRDKHESDLLQMLEQKHGNNFRLFDLESCIPQISLEKLCELCKHIESWLASGHNKIVVLQDRESFQRVGTSVAAYLQYQKICSTNLAPYSIRSGDRNIQDLDEYSMQKFLDDMVGPIKEPSYKRYLEYFIGLLSGDIKINSLPIYLRFIKMESPPCLHHKISHYENEWSSFLKIFEGERFVFISDIYVMPISTRQFIYEIKSPLLLRGDVFVHFFQVHNKSRQTELISSVQFHTCAITRLELEFHKSDISFPQNDEKFPPDHKISLVFNKTAEKGGYGRPYEDVLVLQNPLIRKEPISNYASIADLSQYAQHTHGPVDGSLYATIAKAPSTSSYGDNELTVQNIKTIETRLNTPPTSKNSRILSTILEWDNIRNGENGAGGHHESAYTQNTSQTKHEPKSYARSPLMFSYDSGIYSNEASNRNNASSSAASPTANTSQTELDNLLSEMLLTVETLPDLSYNNPANNKQISEAFPTKKLDASDLRASPQRNLHLNINTSEESKRQYHSKPFNIDNLGYKNNHELGETSSMTTTLTPSESRCNTPAMSDHQALSKSYHNHEDLYYDTDTQLRLHSGKRQPQHNDSTRKEYQRQTENLLQNSSQSNSYMEVLRSENRFGDQPDSGIPYHAREFSKPFSYGVPSSGDGKMLKSQSGYLSSPSMVRKALNHNGTPTSGRKTTSHDFEERAKFGRQIESKYTFGDKTPENNLSVFDSDKMFDYRARSENQKYKDVADIGSSSFSSAFEPLRRSNTMDGSFGRSGYASDGGSSQTWLQLQQQRLRTKRAQRPKEVFDYTDGASRRSQTLSPVRYNNVLVKEPVTVKHTTEQVFVSKPYKLESTPFDFEYRTAANTRSYSEKLPAMSRRTMPITSTPFEALTRNESVSSYRSETETEVSRPETPAFPVTPRTPVHFGSHSTLPPKSPTLQRRDLSNRVHEVNNANEVVSTYTSRRNSSNSAISNANSEPFEIAPHHVKFARDSSRFWYKPAITREEAINLLRNAQPGTFLVRDSTTFANAFGLVVRVAQPPPGIKSQGGDELVRHFLVEPTVRGVRLKGCSNEPVFSSLSALIYQHSVTPLALPCRLALPERDIQQTDFKSPAQQQLVSQGAACNVLYLFSVDTESLTGPQAVRKAIKLLFERKPLPTPTEVHFKVSQQGVTLTDNSRQLFFRKHYSANTITYFGLDPDDHRWSVHVTDSDIPVKNQHIFAFIAKKTGTPFDNFCHIFCELEPRQPAAAIVSFAQKVLLDETARQQHTPAQI